MKDKNEMSKERLLHIQKAIRAIKKYVDDVSLDEFTKNELLHNATLMQFSIIGEAIVHIEESI